MVNRILKTDRVKLATSLAIIFHLIGLAGMLFFHEKKFVEATALNLLLMAGLICHTETYRGKPFYLFLTISFLIGILVEMIGVNTGLLFGNYQYGKILGPKLLGVPLIIGINWFMVMYCIGSSTEILYRKIKTKNESVEKAWSKWGPIIDGALIAVFFDWLMEPVAIKLGYWTWNGNGEIPTYNYVSWFIISLIIMLIFNTLKWKKDNRFAIHLLLIQSMFFLILRTFL